jgi:hypothetical protein
MSGGRSPLAWKSVTFGGFRFKPPDEGLRENAWLASCLGSTVMWGQFVGNRNDGKWFQVTIEINCDELEKLPVTKRMDYIGLYVQKALDKLNTFLTSYDPNGVKHELL